MYKSAVYPEPLPDGGTCGKFGTLIKDMSGCHFEYDIRCVDCKEFYIDEEYLKRLEDEGYEVYREY